MSLSTIIAKPVIEAFFNPIAEKAKELEVARNQKYSIDPNSQEQTTFHYDDCQSFANYTQLISTPVAVFKNEIATITQTRGTENICAIDARKLIEGFTQYQFKDINELDDRYDFKAKEYAMPLVPIARDLVEKFHLVEPTYRQASLAYMFMRIANYQSREDIKKLLVEKIYQPIIALLDKIIQQFPEQSNEANEYFFGSKEKINQWIDTTKIYIDQIGPDLLNTVKNTFNEFPLLVQGVTNNLMNDFEKSFATIGSWFREEYVGIFDTMDRFLWGYEHEDQNTYKDVKVPPQEPKKIFMELKALFEAELKKLDLAKQMREDFLQPLKRYLFELADKYFPAKGDAERIYDGYNSMKVLSDKGIFDKWPYLLR